MLSSTPSSNASKLRSVLAALKAEKSKRQRVKTDRWTRYASDPVGFVEDGLLGTLWSKQKLICHSVFEHRHTAVPSCHGVGKSRGAAIVAAWWISAHEPGEAFVVTLAPTAHQVKGILWREIGRIHAEGNLPGYTNVTEWKLDNGELIGMGRSPKDTDPTAIQGIHQLRVLVIFDEACGIAKPLWDAADTLVTNEMSRFLAIGNPDDPASEFANVCKPGSGWNVIPISAFESPNFTEEPVPAFLRPLLVSKTWVEERKHRWGETSALYKSKVKGEFPEQSKDGLIPISTVSAAVARELQPGEPNELGVDVARFGEDSTVICHRRGAVARKREKFGNRDLMYVTGRVVVAIKETGAKRVKIDDSGLGGGVTDRLRELKTEKGPDGKPKIAADVEIIPVNAGEAPISNIDGDRFKNLRAQMNWGLRERFVDGTIDIDADEDLQAQACDMRYAYSSSGQIVIESKEDMKKRGVPSPDDWDALVLAFGSPPTIPKAPIAKPIVVSGTRPSPGG